MADQEWYCVEAAGRDGGKLQGPAGDSRFPNKETAVEAARLAAPGFEGGLTIAKYTRKEVKVFRVKITIEEADVGTVTPA